MAETYTEEGLKACSRADLRRKAMVELGLNNKQVSEMKTDDIIAQIMEKQDGGSKKRDGKGTTKLHAPKGREPEPKEEAADEDSDSKLDAIGKALDEHDESVKDKLVALERQQYILFGIVSDLYTAQVGSKDEFEERFKELDEEFEKEGN